MGIALLIVGESLEVLDLPLGEGERVAELSQRDETREVGT